MPFVSYCRGHYSYNLDSEEHEWEFIMCMLELKGVLLAVDETLNYLIMLHHHGFVSPVRNIKLKNEPRLTFFPRGYPGWKRA